MKCIIDSVDFRTGGIKNSFRPSKSLYNFVVRLRGFTTLPAILAALFFSSGPLHSFVDNDFGVNFQLVRTPMLPLDEDNPEEGAISVRMNFRWYNAWSIQSNRFIVDGEEFQVAPTIRYQIDPRWQIGFQSSYKVQGGGSMDYSIEKFHQSMGVTQGQRDRFPENSMNVSYEPLGPFYGLIDNNPAKTVSRSFRSRNYPRSPLYPPVSLNGNPWMKDYQEVIPVAGYDRNGPDNPVVFTQYTGEVPGKWIHGYSAGVAIRVAMFGGRKLFRSSGNDFSLFGTLTGDFFNRKLELHGGISYTRFEMRKFLFLKLPAEQYAFRTSLIYHYRDWNFLTELVSFSKPVLHFGQLSRPGYQIAGGVQKTWKDYRINFTAIENFINFGVTPDIGFHFSVERTLI